MNKIPFLTPEEDRRHRLAYNLARLHFICGTGNVTNDMKAWAHYRAICEKLLVKGKPNA